MALMVTQHPQYVMLQWAADKLKLPQGMWVKDSVAVGVVDGKAIRAVMVLNLWTGEGCEASFVSDGSKTWATPKVVSRLLTIPFQNYQMRRVMARVSASHVDTQISALRIGFQFEGRLRAGMPNGDDAILFSMLRDEQPFARKDH